MRVSVISVILCMLSFSCFAQSAPHKPSSPIQEAIDAAYALGLQTGQSVSGMLKADDERLKWVLDICDATPGCKDQWITKWPKQPEPPK